MTANKTRSSSSFVAIRTTAGGCRRRHLAPSRKSSKTGARMHFHSVLTSCVLAESQFYDCLSNSELILRPADRCQNSQKSARQRIAEESAEEVVEVGDTRAPACECRRGPARTCVNSLRLGRSSTSRYRNCLERSLGPRRSARLLVALSRARAPLCSL